ncbi:hypothetical protein BX666DRAFT_941755 [Dichotomocladium elegans]|nr:hypothetical protein BX666DRAFT_941755 [Dichotomocladium elegans]
MLIMDMANGAKNHSRSSAPANIHHSSSPSSSSSSSASSKADVHPRTASSNKRSKQSRLSSKSSPLTYSTSTVTTSTAKKAQQDDFESLQITFYEIESWIEKTTPVLARMTKELDKASQHFQKRKQELRNEEDSKRKELDAVPPQAPAVLAPRPPQISGSLATGLPEKEQPSLVPQHQIQQQQSTTTEADPSTMQWTLSFQPGNSLRLETNIRSIDQLVEAVRKISVLADEPGSASSTLPMNDKEYPADEAMMDDATPSPSTSMSRSVSVWIDPLATDPSTEYWHIAIGRRPQTCLEKYKHCEMNLSRLTEDVSPSVLNYIGQLFWDCLHPKFTCDWYSFWDRSGDPKRNQVCIDSGLAIVFLHVIRHDNTACNNALDIAYYYYDRARESLMEFFDSPDCATLETLLNLAMFCTVCKRHSQARIYTSLAFRMMLEMDMLHRSRLPQDRIMRKQYMKLFMVLYYNDITTAIYSGDTFVVMDENCDIDFYEMIELNKLLHENGEAGCDDNMVVKETYFVHLLELMRLMKQTTPVLREYEQQYSKNYIPATGGELPLRWAKRIQAIEVSLARWFDRLPEYYRVDPQPRISVSIPSKRFPRDRHPIPPEILQDQAALLLMLQYQTQWIVLHKTFLGKHLSPSFTPPYFDVPLSLSPISGSAPSIGLASSSSSSSSPPSPASTPILPQQRVDRSHAICTDAANRIVVLTELITEKYGWCVYQQFITSIYHASTIFCRNALTTDTVSREHAKHMIHRVIRVLRSNDHNYQGLPHDLNVCLNEFLVKHDMQPPPQVANNEDDLDEIQQQGQGLTHFNDTLSNSPHNYRQLLQPLHTTMPSRNHSQRHTFSAASVVGQGAVVPAAIQDIDMLMIDAEEDLKSNWRYKFSSCNIAQSNHRVI